MRRAVRIVLVSGGSIAAALALVGLSFDEVARRAMTPSDPFDAAASPPPPDYADSANWSALPDRDDAADAVPPGAHVIDQRTAPVDAFYLHPTTYVGPLWNAPAGDPDLNATTDRVATQIQATAFNGCCAVYAPRYRQINGLPFIKPTPDGELAVDLAYSDVRRAFAAFQARRGAGRPFILAAHSQGTVLAERLLHEQISGTPRAPAALLVTMAGARV